MKDKFLIFSRWFLGSVFIFSGFVKGIDPAGLQYKLDDYLEALNIRFLDFLAFPNTFLLPFAEFAVGAALITGFFIKFSSKLALAFMGFFLPLTFYIALKNPVTDCGCFGDALVITNWETFYKNIILIFLSIVLVIRRKDLQFVVVEKLRYAGFFVLISSYIAIVCWSFIYEPLIDFRPYKVGVNIAEAMKIPEGAPKDTYETTYHYRNRKTNEVNKFGDKDFPWQDTINWKFESMDPPKLIKQGYKPPIHDFSIQNSQGEDLTLTYLNDSVYTFVVIMYDLQKSNFRQKQELNTLASWSKGKGFHFIGLTSTSGAALEKFKQEWQPSFEIFFADQTTLKTIVRSNPGLMLLKKGTIIVKWSNNDFPSSLQVEQILQSDMNKKLNP